MESGHKAKDLDAYIADFPAEIQHILQSIRELVHREAPHAKEAIKYNMPAFVQGGNLVYFAAFKNHIGFFPVPTGDPNWDKALAGYQTGKGSIQFPYNKPIPYDLISDLVKDRQRRMQHEGNLK